MEKVLGKYSAHLYAVMRVVIGLLFACSAQKLFGAFGGMGGGSSAPLFH